MKMCVYRFVKRALDIIFSLTAVIFLAPLMLFIAVLVRINLGAPILFKQKRIGRYGKVFTLYKFRSMKNGIIDSKGNDGDAERLTKFGLFIRKTSLDELPQLFNILIGNMSIIGPRPKTIFEVMLMKDTKYIYRHCVKPGLSSWAVIHGRNNIPNDVALNYDLENVAKFSFILDIKVFFGTLKYVLNRTGINTDGSATFVHLSDFLVQKGFANEERVHNVFLESNMIAKSNLKYLPLNVNKYEFKKTRVELENNEFNVKGFEKEKQ